MRNMFHIFGLCFVSYKFFYIVISGLNTWYGGASQLMADMETKYLAQQAITGTWQESQAADIMKLNTCHYSRQPQVPGWKAHMYSFTCQLDREVIHIGTLGTLTAPHAYI